MSLLRPLALVYWARTPWCGSNSNRPSPCVPIQSALAYIATKNGGTLRFPEGDYVVGGVPGFKGIALPSGVIRISAVVSAAGHSSSTVLPSPEIKPDSALSSRSDNDLSPIVSRIAASSASPSSSIDFDHCGAW